VIGGGPVAERKTRVLLKCGALVKVVSPELNPGLASLFRRKKVQWSARGYSDGCLRKAFLAVAATGERGVNHRASSYCRKNGILVNVVDVPQESDFIAPAFVEKNGLVIAVSTSGLAPCLARKIRRDLGAGFMQRYSGILKQLSRARKKLKITCPEPSRRKSALNKLINSRI